MYPCIRYIFEYWKWGVIIKTIIVWNSKRLSFPRLRSYKKGPDVTTFLLLLFILLAGRGNTHVWAGLKPKNHQFSPTSLARSLTHSPDASRLSNLLRRVRTCVYSRMGCSSQRSGKNHKSSSGVSYTHFDLVLEWVTSPLVPDTLAHYRCYVLRETPRVGWCESASRGSNQTQLQEVGYRSPDRCEVHLEEQTQWESPWSSGLRVLIYGAQSLHQLCWKSDAVSSHSKRTMDNLECDCR